MSKNFVSELLVKQFSEGFDTNENMLNKNRTKDKYTHSARIYEATRLSQEFLRLEIPI